MFYELIYTRCRKGVDILKHGQPIEKDGYKVYACSNELLSGDIVDLNFLHNAAHGKQSFKDPTFMDDAYLYFTPDNGKHIFNNFHPVPYDENATGDYSHRSGNHINHIYVGDFHEFYPYELFGSSYAWYAKTRNEVYYYETAPTALAPKSTIDDEAGSILQDDIAQFVSDGRKGAVAAAVAFLLNQYSLPVERRKYLVIHDDSSEKIELWIAAIESAFSPKMASGLSFATRLDKFVNQNLYTVNLNGQFQSAINLQDPNQRPRFKAMIVGVNDRDLDNCNAVRQMPNLPYAVLKGKEKSFMSEVDISHAYYNAITSYNQHHIRFCREFLQMTELERPHTDVLKLYEAYAALEAMSAGTPASMIATALSTLSRFNLKYCNYIKILYEKLKLKLHSYLQENLSAAFSIIDWLQQTSSLVGDPQAAQSFERIVNDAFAQSLFTKTQDTETENFWNSIRSSAFFDTVADTITNEDVIAYYNEKINQFTADSWITFINVYLTCAQKVSKCSEREIHGIVSRGLYACYTNNDTTGALQICKSINENCNGAVKPLLLKIATSTDSLFNSFCIHLILHASPELTANDNNALLFCKELQSNGFGQVCVVVLQQRAKKLQNTVEQERFITAVAQDYDFASLDLTSIFTILDSSIALADKGTFRIADLLQRFKPQNAMCINSAHVCATALFSSKNSSHDISQALGAFAAQGFPGIENESFVDKLVDNILSCNLEAEELTYIIKLFHNSDFYFDRLVTGILSHTTSKKNYEWNMLLYVMAQNRNLAIKDTIITKILTFKQPAKLLAQLENAITEPSLKAHFDSIAAIVDDELQKNQPQSMFGKLFGFKSKKNK